MQHKEIFAAVNLTLKDIFDNENHLFGGIPVVLRGDFAQTLPIILLYREEVGEHNVMQVFAALYCGFNYRFCV